MKKSPKTRFFKACSSEPGVASSEAPTVPIKTPKPPSFPLPEKRRQFLIDLRNREIMKAKKTKLQAILLKKMQSKFKGKNHRILNSVIEEFLVGRTKLVSSELGELELMIRDALARAPKLPQMAERDSIDGFNEGTNNLEKRSNVENLDSLVQDLNIRGAEWKILDAYQQISNEEQKIMEKDREMSKKKKYLAGLQAQLEEQNLRQQRENNEKENYKNVIVSDVTAFEKDVQIYQEKKKEKSHNELSVLKNEIIEKQRRKEEERRQIQAEDSLLLKKIAEDLKAEKIKQIHQKEREKEFGRQAREENARLREERMVQRQIEAEKDKEIMRIAEEKAAKEARDREEAFQRRMKEQERIAEKFASEGAGKADMEARHLEEQLLFKVIAEKEEAARLDDLKRKQARAERERKMQMDNNRMLERNAMERQKQAEEDRQTSERLRKEEEEYKKDVLKARQDDRQKKLRYRNTLEQQMKSQSHNDIKLETMVPREKAMNMDILKKVVDDPAMLSRIAHRLRMKGQ